MKRGDTLICKKELKENADIIKGKEYVIFYVDSNNTFIDVDIHERFTRRFYIKGIFNIDEYFYTPEELRILKLNSL